MTAANARPSLVTIGLPCYNSERYIAQAIDSLLAQTFEDFTLIISDNASTDRTGEICQRYAAADPRVRYTRNPANIGLTGNFNRVFTLSESKYFKWATADDYSGKTVLADAVAILEADPSVVLCYPRTVLVDEHGAEQGRYTDKLHLMQDDPGERFIVLTREIGLVNHHLGLLRADAIRKTRLFGPHVHADIGFLAELVLYGKFHELPGYDFFRRFHPDSSSWNRNDPEHQKRRFHAAKKRGIPFNTWRFHATYFAAIYRSPLPLPRKLALTRVLIKMLYWDRKPLGEELMRDLSQVLRR